MTAVRGVLARIGSVVRGGWMVLGITLAILLVIELGFRVKQQLSGELVPYTPTPPEYASADWYRDFTAEYDATRAQRWKPYVYFGRHPSFTGRYINLDSLGRRVTPQPAGLRPAARVFFFGGSTIWGTAQRDDHTIAAEAARRLQPLAPAGSRIEVINFGEGGYVSTQGVIALYLALRAGNVPDVVVFYDGINDVIATVQAGEAGLPQNEAKRVAEFQAGRLLDRTGIERGPKKDLRSLGWLALTALKQLAVVDWVLSLRSSPPSALIAADSAAKSTVRIYAHNVRAVEALAREYGFSAIYVWQPSIHGTAKPLTPYETRIMNTITSNPTHARMRDVHLAVPALLDSAMAEVAPGKFVNAASLFRNDSSNVYFDRVGHNIEASVPTIVDAFWPLLRAAVTRHIAT